jgi:flagellar basal body-associated protein FliL
MAAPTAAERADAAGPAVAPPRHLMSPLCYGVLVAIMAVTAGFVFFVTRNFQDAGQKPVMREAYEEIDLGQVSRELAPDTSNLVREQFMIRVVLLLNPRVQDLGEMKMQVEKRRNLLKYIVSNEIIYPKTDSELRAVGTLDSLAHEIRQRLNAEFGAGKDGQDVIHKVIFPDSRLPIRH